MKNNLFRLSLLTLLMALSVGCVDDGADGINGTNGADGQDGQAGQDGQNGQDGTNGNLAVYTVQITNLTYSQPFSPAAVILHEPGYNAFIDGVQASIALEELAEGGNPTSLMDDASFATEFLDAVSTGAPTAPRSIGSVSTLLAPVLDVDDLRLTVVTMLVDTNDAFTGLNAMNISNMTVGQTRSFTTPSWDAGTEANLESAATMPGPAATAAGGGGEAAGFNSARDDLFDRVSFHRGVVTNANQADPSLEGLSTSVLDEGDRWDNPTSRVVVTRTR